MTHLRIAALVMSLALASSAFADDTLAYKSEGGCAGDFDRVQLKSLFLRVDAGGESGSTMIYDHGEKLAFFIDHRTHSFMQTEMDEDAVDLQADIMKSLRTKMRHESGVDPFEMVKSLCPGAGAGSRDRQPDEGIDCGNGMTIGGATTGADGKAMTSQQMAEAMKAGGGMQLDAGTQEMMQKMVEQQLAHMPADQRAQVQQMMANGGAGMPVAGSKAPPPAAPPRIDRDAGEIDVGGITCMRREHLRGDEMLREDCYATTATLHLDEVETRRLARFSKAILEWSHSLAPEGMQAPKDDRVLVRRVCYAGGHENGRATLAIEHAPIAESRFEVPAGYKPMDLGMGGASERERR